MSKASKSAHLEGFLFFSPAFLMKENFLSQVLRKMRRSYFSIFKKEYVRENMRRREGDCNRCGACCELVYKCPFVARDKDDMAYCRVYGSFQPASCRNYPFDEVDSEVEICSYTFSSKK